MRPPSRAPRWRSPPAHRLRSDLRHEETEGNLINGENVKTQKIVVK